MLRLDVSWDRKKQSGQFAFNAGFTKPPIHLVTLYCVSLLSGAAAVRLAGKSLLWALELTILSDVGNILILSVLLPTVTKKVKESKLSVTSTPEKYGVRVAVPNVVWQSIALLSVMTWDATANVVNVYRASFPLALLYFVALYRSCLALIQLVLPLEPDADSKVSDLVSCLIGLRLTEIIGEQLLGLTGEETAGDDFKGSSSEGEVGKSRDDDDEEGVNNSVEVLLDGRRDDVIVGWEIESLTTEISSGVVDRDVHETKKSLTESKMRESRIDGEKEEEINNDEEWDGRDQEDETGAADGSTADNYTDAQSDGWDWEHV